MDYRRKNILVILQSFTKGFNIKSIEKYLDFGCGDGTFTVEVARLLNVSEVYGIDIDIRALEHAASMGIHVIEGDLNQVDLPFKDYFDIVSAFDVIEHLYNTDNLLRQAYKSLKPGGILIITTPNIASWINRLLLFLGYLPFEYEVSSLYNLEERPLQKVKETFGHVRLYSFKTLEKHLRVYGFNIVHSSSYMMGYAASRSLTRITEKFLSSLRKTLGSGIFMVAIK